jgi:hypothetical protein
MRGEANREANRLFLATRGFCGAGHVLAIDVTPPPSSGFAPVLGAPTTPTGGYTLYLVMSGVTSRLSGEKAAGPQWQGRIGFVAERARMISIGRDGTRGAWTPLAGGEVYAVDLSYRQGWTSEVRELTLLADRGRYAKARRPACSEIPGGWSGT